MAETETPSPPSQAGKGIGGTLGKKFGPLPVWGWGLVGGLAAVFIYRYFAAKSAASSAAATPASVSNASDLGAGTNSTPGSNGYQDSGQLTQLQTQLASLQQQVNGGTGGGAGPGVTTGPNYQLLQNQGDVQQAIGAGWQIFTQPAPGMFTPWNGKAISSGYGTSVEPAILYTTGAPLPAPVTTSGAGGSASPVGVGTAGPPSPIQPHQGVGPLPASGPLV